jgi:hypothetical protein
MRDPDEGISPDGTIMTGVRRGTVPSQIDPIWAEAVTRLSAWRRGDQETHRHGLTSRIDCFTAPARSAMVAAGGK